jgi:radical SAM superfamily enzyme YgiQ (UPF0313 family)
MANACRKVLLIYPTFPNTYWGFHFALPLVGKKAAMPPLGLITVAAMFPPDFDLRLRDLNCAPLSDEDIAWADVVLMSAMLIQSRSLFEVAGRCRDGGKPVVMGGPFPTMSPDECKPWCDSLVSGEAEAVWDRFLDDLVHDNLQPVYASDDKPDVTLTPVPRFDLLNVDDYLTIPIQFSRGCPFQCEFCDIIVMFGRRPRTKTTDQMILELEAVRRTGYRGEIFIVDDNFIGNKKAAKQLLPAVRQWNDLHDRQFSFGTEASVDLAEHDELMDLMARSGFRWVFLGIETPSRESLEETLKFQNLRHSLAASVARIRAAGINVSAGFIIGFDSDGDDIFDRQIDFISDVSIPLAIVGLLFALNGTPLHDRMKAAGRLDDSNTEMDGANFAYTNIRTLLPRRTLLEGYRRVLFTLYSPDRFFERALESLIRLKRPGSFRKGLADLRWEVGNSLRFLKSARIPGRGRVRGALSHLKVMSVVVRSTPGEFWSAYARFALRLLWTRPDRFGGAGEAFVYGYHLYRFTMEHVQPQLDGELARLPNEDRNLARG